MFKNAKYNKIMSTCKAPFLKILCSIAIIVLLASRNSLFQIDDQKISIIVDAFCGIVAVICILTIYKSGYQILESIEKNEKDAFPFEKATNQSALLHISKVLKLLEENDIIEIWVLYNNKIVTIGSRSDSLVGSSKFFDKDFFIEDKVFANIEDLEKALLGMCSNNYIRIISIDGITPEGYKEPDFLSPENDSHR